MGNDSDSPSSKAPPTPERMEEFFALLRARIATARKFASAGRDYALFRTLYHAGVRADEAATLELADLISSEARSARAMCASARGAKGSGPRPRWLPMLGQLDLILRWFVYDVALASATPRRCSATRAAGPYTGAASATVSATCSSSKGARRKSGSAPAGAIRDLGEVEGQP
ncbi:MAG: hypothetical protein M3198_13990 [Actinomycetota bacterium]|nr:hypothetical protein [Actinomycetota bacterium]